MGVADYEHPIAHAPLLALRVVPSGIPHLGELTPALNIVSSGVANSPSPLIINTPLLHKIAGPPPFANPVRSIFQSDAQINSSVSPAAQSIYIDQEKLIAKQNNSEVAITSLSTKAQVPIFAVRHSQISEFCTPSVNCNKSDETSTTGSASSSHSASFEFPTAYLIPDVQSTLVEAEVKIDPMEMFMGETEAPPTPFHFSAQTVKQIGSQNYGNTSTNTGPSFGSANTSGETSSTSTLNRHMSNSDLTQPLPIMTLVSAVEMSDYNDDLYEEKTHRSVLKHSFIRAQKEKSTERYQCKKGPIFSGLSTTPSDPHPLHVPLGKHCDASNIQALRRYGCAFCDRRFARPSSLKTHMHTHTGERPFECTVIDCGRRFSVLSNLRRHMKICAVKKILTSSISLPSILTTALVSTATAYPSDAPLPLYPPNWFPTSAPTGPPLAHHRVDPSALYYKSSFTASTTVAHIPLKPMTHPIFERRDSTPHHTLAYLSRLSTFQQAVTPEPHILLPVSRTSAAVSPIMDQAVLINQAYPPVSRWAYKEAGMAPIDFPVPMSHSFITADPVPAHIYAPPQVPGMQPGMHPKKF